MSSNKNLNMRQFFRGGIHDRKDFKNDEKII